MQQSHECYNWLDHNAASNHTSITDGRETEKKNAWNWKFTSYNIFTKFHKIQNGRITIKICSPRIRSCSLLKRRKRERERERGRERKGERQRERERDQAIIKYSMDMKSIKTENVRNWQQRVRRKYTVHEMNLHNLVQNHGSWMDI